MEFGEEKEMKARDTDKPEQKQKNNKIINTLDILIRETQGR